MSCKFAQIYCIAGEFGRGKDWRIGSFQAFGERKFGKLRSANRLLIVSTNLNSFNLANHRRFAKFAKLSPRQTFPLYGKWKGFHVKILNQHTFQ